MRPGNEKTEERLRIRSRRIQQARERWRAAQELRHSEARLRLLVDASLDAIITTNTRGMILEWNRQAEALFGWTAQEVAGLLLTPTILPPRCHAAYDAELACFLTADEGPQLSRRLELFALRRDGSELSVELTTMAQRIGDTSAFITIARDITERKASEAALRFTLEQMEEQVAERTAELQRVNSILQLEIAERAHSEEKLRYSSEWLHKVMTGASVILFALDKNGIFTLSEGQGLQTFGLEPGQIVGQSVYELYCDHPQALVDISRALTGETLDTITPIGELVFETRYSPQRNAQGDIIGVIGVSADVTERTRIETALRDAKETAESANRAKSQFLANISHELRTPLNAIIGFSEILCDQNFGELNAKQARYAENVLVSGRHLLQLINTILDLSKIESGKMALNISVFDPSAALQEIGQITSALAAEKRIALLIQPNKDLPFLSADQDKFKQALHNLISNAIKFTPEQGCVTVSATIRTSRTDGRFLEISVADTGIGVLLEEQERIFAEFEQADASDTRRQQGTGLGLTLTRRIVELHGGILTVQSEGEGRGSVFRFFLPIDRPAGSAAPSC